MGLFNIHPSQTLYISIIFTYMAQSEYLENKKSLEIYRLEQGAFFKIQSPANTCIWMELIVPVIQNVNSLI